MNLQYFVLVLFYVRCVSRGFADVTSFGTDVNIVLLWSPSESRFSEESINHTLHSVLWNSTYNVTIVQDQHLFQYIFKEHNESSSMTVFVDLREYACPEVMFRNKTLVYVTVSQVSCVSRTSGTGALQADDLVVAVDTVTFDRGSLVAQLTNSTQRTTTSQALLFDDSGEEHFFRKSASYRLPLVFEISAALDKCAAKEQLKNLTAKTEIRDVVVTARASCITDLLTEASNLQLLFGRYRWLLYPTDGQFPECPACRNVNGIILLPKTRTQSFPVTRAEKLLHFVELSLAEMKGVLTPQELANCNTCSLSCTNCTQAIRHAMIKTEGEKTMVFLRENSTTARTGVTFQLYIMAQNISSHVPVGEWSEGKGLVLTTSSKELFPHSKSDIVLRAVVVIEQPFVFKRESEGGTYYEGYSLDVLQKISEIVGFTYVVRECLNNDYGSSRMGEWSGCVGNVMRGEADVIVGALTVTAEREEVVDFTLPYYDFAGIQILMKKNAATVKLFYFVDVFTKEAWLCLFGVIILTSFLLFVFERFSPKTDHDSGERSAYNATQLPKAFDLKDSIWFVIGSVTLAGGGEPPRCLASRLLVAGFWFFSVVIMSTFTANLAAFLTVSRMGTSIASLDELAAQSEIKYSVVRDSNVRAYFEHQAAIEKNFYELWKNMSLGGSGASSVIDQSLAVWDYPLGDKFGNMWDFMKGDLLNSTQEGIERVYEGKFALITESPVIKYLTSKDCSLVAVGDQFSVRPYAFALKEKSLFTAKFTTAILQLQKERELEKLKQKWWDDGKISCPTESNDQGLDLSSLTGTFIVMGAGLVLGLVILGVECLLSRRNRQQSQRGHRETKDSLAEGDSKPVATIDVKPHTDLAAVDHALMARDLRKRLELRQSAGDN